ncbi:phosphoribosylformylglycinamidine synthase subunit PurQ [Candidatus Gottesmanbacteria bacterium]|nr:phosphoribosylformylglycinamidine synthase subunit PurQ [Candidatus Gottesmanbacteria bacterium]
MKPRVLVFSGYGLNSEEETKYAFDWAGGKADIIHINDLIEGFFNLNKYQIMALPGGFAYGDDTGAGNAYALKLKNHLWEEILSFVENDGLIIGICNGFQILVNLGLLPGFKGKYGERKIGLMPNKSARYVVRFVDLKVETEKSFWLKGIDKLSIPVSNGEGRLCIADGDLELLNIKKMVALRYIKGEMCRYLDLPANPNGSIEDIAGICDESGRILGIMPHPERAQFFYQLPNWTYIKEQYKREGRKMPYEGPGLKLFQNAIKYYS